MTERLVLLSALPASVTELATNYAQRLLQHSPKHHSLSCQVQQAGARSSLDLADEVGTSGATGLLLSLRTKIDRAFLERLHNHRSSLRLRVISTMSVGLDHIDVEECTKHGILVGYTPDVLTESVADLIVTLMLCAARQIPYNIERVRNLQWRAWQPFEHLGRDVHSSTVGFIGFGRIARATSRRLKAFGCRVLYFSRTRLASSEENLLGIEFCQTQNQLLSESDFVIPLVPLSETTRRMCDKSFFANMKQGSIFVNAARGDIVDQDELLAALRSGHLWAAAVDVCSPEPLPAESPLRQQPNLIILPHIGSATEACRRSMLELTVRNAVFWSEAETSNQCAFVNVRRIKSC